MLLQFRNTTGTTLYIEHRFVESIRLDVDRNFDPVSPCTHIHSQSGESHYVADTVDEVLQKYHEAVACTP